MKKISLLMLICLILASCNDSDILFNGNGKSVEFQEPINTNPMDSVGIWHNLVLEKMIEYSHLDFNLDLSGLDLETTPLGSNYLNNLLADYFEEANDNLGYPNIWSKQQIINSIVESNYQTVTDPEAFFNEFKTKLSAYSEKDSIYMVHAFYYVMLAMDSVCVNGLDSNYNFDNIYNTLISNLDNLVGTMLADTLYPHNSIGYKSLAVLQHSLEFWKNYYDPTVMINLKSKSTITGMTKRGKDVSNFLWAATTDFYTGSVWPVTSAAAWWALDKWGSGYWDAVSDGVWSVLHGLGL